MDSKGRGKVPKMSHEQWKKSFMSLKEMIEALYFKNQPNEAMASLVRGGGGEGGDPFESSSPSSGNSANRHSSKKSSHTHNEPPSHNPLLKLDVKFDLPIYDGESNEEKLDS